MKYDCKYPKSAYNVHVAICRIGCKNYSTGKAM
jgi:hypothetical protein